MNQVNKSRRWDVFSTGLKIAAFTMFLFHALVTVRLPLDVTDQQVIHLAFAFVLIYGAQISEGKTVKNALYAILLIGSLVSLGYILANKEALEWRSGIPTQTDLVLGIILIVSVFWATYKGWGIILPILVGIGVLYDFFGYLLPSAIAAPHLKFEYIISSLSTGLSGIFGPLLTVSFLYIFLFIIFGQLLGASGATVLINEGGKWLSQRTASGAPLTATFGSAIIGTCTGSATANVFLTGAFTIPMMKKAGIRSDFAGAVEALASTGGQVMPPVMGAAAFVMAYYVGVHYFEIVKAAWLPAVLFFISCGFGAHFYCKVNGIKAMPGGEQQGLGIIIRKGSIFLVGVAVLMILLFKRYSPAYSVSISMAVMLVVILLESAIWGNLRRTLRDLFDYIARGARIGADIGMCIALLGIFAQVFYTTGLGTRLGAVLYNLAGGNMLLGFIMLGVLALILGTGLGTTPAYLVAAMVCAPGLIRLGAEPMVAHFFTLYWAVFSCVTPPVAVGALAACKLSGASYFKTAIAATRLAFPIFFMPFIFAYRPELLLAGNSMAQSLSTFSVVAILVIFAQGAAWGFLLTRMAAWERGLIAVGVIIVTVNFIVPAVTFVPGLGLVLLALVGLNQFRKWRRTKRAAVQQL